MVKLIIGTIGIKRLQGRVAIVPVAAGGGTGKMQEKTVTPSTAAQVVTPDGGYAGLSRVNVAAAKLQDKIVEPSTGGQVVQADDGSLALGTVTVQGAPLQSKTVTPGTEQQTVTPDTGFYGLGSVTVPGDGNLVPANIAKDVTIFGITGTMEAAVVGSTVKVTEVSVDETAGSYTLTYEDGTEVTGMVTFDTFGLPVALTDNQGNSVTFDALGWPTVATNADGHTVTITRW